MSDAVFYTVRDGVAFLAVSNPPANALSLAVRAGLVAGISRAEAETGVSAVVILGRGRSFPSGADISELNSPPKGPSLAEVCDRVENCSKPVVAVLHANALGGGFELALAAHFRIAHGATRVGLPDIKLGLMPSAGATQRMPRLVGAEVSLAMMLSGRPFAVNSPPAQVFFDVLTEGDPAQAALEFCKDLRSTGQGPRRTRDIRSGFNDPVAYQAEIARRREIAAQGHDEAANEIISAVEAALLLPFEAGQAMERESFAGLVKSDQSAALRHAFLAERMAPRFGLPGELEVPEIKTICVLGGGPLAMQIAAAGLQAGLAVKWGTRDEGARALGVQNLRALFQRGVERGAVTQERVDQLLANLTHGDSAGMTEGVDMILHAARGQGAVPAPAGTVRAVAMPERVDELGLRFALPVYAARLVEVVQGPGASDEQMATGLALARALNKVAVRVVSMGDSIAGRMMAAFQRAADALVDAGQSPYAVDAALRDWGWMRPPFELRDAIGLGEFAQLPRGEGARNWSKVLLDMGRSGRTKAAGFYGYPVAGGPPRPDADVTRILDTTRDVATPMAGSQIVALIVGALANEGVRMLREGWVERPSDIDLVMMLAHDFPRWRGGPMKAVDLMGLFTVSRTMQRFEHPDKGFWTPDPAIAELIKNGRKLCDMTGKTV